MGIWSGLCGTYHVGDGDGDGIYGTYLGHTTEAYNVRTFPTLALLFIS